jgi:hypothetical protein
LDSFNFQGFSLLILNDHGVFLGSCSIGHLNFGDLCELNILHLGVNLGNQFLDLRSVVFAGRNSDGWVLDRFDVLNLSFEGGEVNDGGLLGLLVLGDGDLLGGVSVAVLENNHVLDRLGTLGVLKTLDIRRIDLDVVVFECFNNYLHLSGLFNFVGGDSLGSVVVGLDNSCGGLGGDDFSFSDKLNVTRGFILKHNQSLLLSVLLGHDENLLDVAAFLDLDAFDLILPKGGSDLVQVVEGFLGLNVLGEGVLGDDSDGGLFRFLDVLELIAEDLFNLLDFD